MVVRKGMPEQGELVLCSVQRITPYAAWCKLEEYQDREGMMHVSEVSGKWVHDIREFVKMNKQYVAKVIRIDIEKNHINLSLKRVSEKEAKEKMNAFRREQRAEKILEQAARELGKNLNQAYEEVGFMLQEKFGEMFVAFEEARTSLDILRKKGVPEEWVNVISKILEKSFREKKIVIKADLEMKSFAEDGIEKIKIILGEIREKTGAEIKYISAPRYRVQVTGKDPKVMEKKLVESLETALKEIEQSDGEGSYKLIR